MPACKAFHANMADVMAVLLLAHAEMGAELLTMCTYVRPESRAHMQAELNTMP